MIQFNKVILHNFGSYGHAEVNLQNRGFCLVSGNNHYKKDNAISNGSGKSFLWSAICFTLTGETINGLKSNLKNINAAPEDKSSYTTLEFCAFGDTYEITRQIAPHTDLKIIKNNVDVSGKGIRESEKKLADLLPDLNKDLISSTIIIGQGMPNKFSSFSPSGRKELLEKLTKSDFMIEDLKARVATRLTDLNTKIRSSEDSLLVNNTQLTTTKQLLDQKELLLKNKIAPDFDSEIKQLQKQLSELQNIVADNESIKNEINQQVETDTAALIEQNSAKTDRLNSEYAQYSENITKLHTQQASLAANIRNLQQEIARLKAITDVCPTCGQKLQNVVKPSTASQEAQLATLNQQLINIQTEINTCNTDHNKYLAEIEQIFKDNISELESRLMQNKTVLQQCSLKQTAANQQITINQTTINQLTFEKSNWDNVIASLNTEISGLQTTITSLTNAITLITANQNELIEHQAVVKKMETLLKRDFRGYLLANIINYIDKKAKDYCEIVFNTRDLNVYLDGNSLDISYAGKMFDNLSGGEKQRVDLILQFAIRNMLMTYLNTNSNILVLDEITDFLDKQSCAAVMKLVEQELNTIESVFIISHHADELDLPIDSEIQIIKNENGISEVL